MLKKLLARYRAFTDGKAIQHNKTKLQEIINQCNELDATRAARLSAEQAAENMRHDVAHIEIANKYDIEEVNAESNRAIARARLKYIEQYGLE